jgi:hypothetical protein
MNKPEEITIRLGNGKVMETTSLVQEDGKVLAKLRWNALTKSYPRGLMKQPCPEEDIDQKVPQVTMIFPDLQSIDSHIESLKIVRALLLIFKNAEGGKE